MSSPNLKQKKVTDFFKDYKIESSGWLSTDTKQSSKSRTEKKTRKARNAVNPLNKEAGSSGTKKNENKENSKTGEESNIKFQRNDSFEKYGRIMPSHEDVLELKAQLEKDKELLRKHKEMLEEDIDEILPTFKFVSRNQIPPEDLLDCKLISNEKLKEYLDENVDYLNDIRNEVITLDRHEMYKNVRIRPRLRINYSTLVFTQKQNEYLLQLLDEKFDKDGKSTEYLLMVFLPELCLKIFMKMHNMSRDEAEKYLLWRPLE